MTNATVPAYDVLDLSVGWSISDTLSLRAGVDNVFDTDPKSTGKTYGYSTSQPLSAVCTGQVVGCQNPTSYTVANQSPYNAGLGTTNGGYYDTLGRRYFVGLKARF